MASIIIKKKEKKQVILRNTMLKMQAMHTIRVLVSRDWHPSKEEEESEEEEPTDKRPRIEMETQFISFNINSVSNSIQDLKIPEFS